MNLKPTLVVGLGGTGIQIGTYIKKEIITQIKTWPVNEVRVIVLDTDLERLGNDEEKSPLEQPIADKACLEEDNELIYVGNSGEVLAKSKFQPHTASISNWLSEAYLKTLEKESRWNLELGAGRLRQFGRLAIFKELVNSSNQKVYNALVSKLEHLTQLNTLDGIQVCLISSFAGGTGAGMFIDIAYLIRVLSEQPKIKLGNKISVVGYLISSDESEMYQGGKATISFNTLRELERFQITLHSEEGSLYSSMIYNPLKDDSTKTERNNKNLFDNLYIFENRSGENTHLVLPKISCAIIDSILI